MKRKRTEVGGAGMTALIFVIFAFAISGLMPLWPGPRTVDDWAKGGLFLAIATGMTWVVATRVRI